MKKLYCEECLKHTNFERIKVKEEVSIKNLKFEVTQEYDKCEECGELFEPFEDIDKNINNEFNTFRKLKGYLQPSEIINIRKRYNISQRQFAEIIGIGFSTLSNIENGALHNSYQDSLFRLSESPTAFLKLVKEKQPYIKENVEQVIETLEDILIDEDPTLVDIKVKFDDTLSLLVEKQNYNTRTINGILHDLKVYEVRKNQEFYEEEKSKTWKGKISNLLVQN